MDYNAVVSFLTSKTGIVAGLGALLSLVLAFIMLYQTIKESKSFSFPDLVISSFDDNERLIALPGYPVIYPQDQERPAFTGGLIARITRRNRVWAKGGKYNENQRNRS